MEWALLVVVLALVVGLGRKRAAAQVQPLARPIPRSGPRPTSAAEPPLLGADDERELERLFAAAEREGSDHLVRVLEMRMHEVIHRQVPVRAIKASPARRVARICFSNGVVVLATTRHTGDLVDMAAAMLRTSVTLRRFEITPDGPGLHFGWRHGGRLDVVAVGLDQAD